MKRSIAFLLLSLTACVYPALVDGNGRLSSVERSVPGFTAVTNRSSIPIVVYEGDQPRAVLTIDSNLHSLVGVSVSGGTLEVQTDVALLHSHLAVLELVTPHLEQLAATSSGSIWGGPFHAREAKVALSSSSSGEIDWAGEADEVDVEVSSSGAIRLSGTGDAANLLNAETRSSGEIDALELVAHNARLSTSSSGSIRATLGGGTLSLYLTSSGSIEWHGSGVIVDLVDTGSGQIVHVP